MHDITYWGEASMRARAVPEGRPVRCGELKKGMGSAPAAGTRKGRSENLPFLYTEGYQFSNQTHRGVGRTVQTGSEV